MSDEITRVFSDVHFGDRASRVRRLAQLGPLLEGVSQLALNGDTLDTRVGPAPAQTAADHAEVMVFFRQAVPAVTYVTGNHDPDVSMSHVMDFAAGQVCATHGDIFFENIVPWGRDAALITQRIEAERRSLPENAPPSLEQQFGIWRRVAASIPQRHQSERHGLKYAWRFAADTVWPPTRFLRILRAWKVEPGLAATWARQHRPAANFILTGHTHRPGIWQMPGGLTVINTGSFCPPLGGYAVDISSTRLVVREVTALRGAFQPGRSVAEFALAAG